MVKVRFAPSPTGYLHVGGARTALFNYLFAKATGGKFVLRIEDTDQERSKPEHTQAIIDGMKWLGFEPDEGPYFQADGFLRHRELAGELMFDGFAYPIFEDDEIETERVGDKEQKVKRPGIRDRARQLEAHAAGAEDHPDLYRRINEEPHAIALRVPDVGVTEWRDLVHGKLSFRNADIEDFLLVRSDGVPLYNLACTLDDRVHGITHVLRGDDHITNTPKQILICDALGVDAPQFGHLPMILGADGERLSKRHGATSVQQYAEEGVLPEALVNFLALLGWNPGDEEEIMSLDRLVKRFDVSRVQKKAAVFDTRKLAWMNAEYFKALPIEAVREQVRRFAIKSEDWMDELIQQFQQRSSSFADLMDRIEPFFPEAVIVYDPATVEKHWNKDPDLAAELLTAAKQAIIAVTDNWTPEAIEASLRESAASMGVGFGKVMHPLRLALTGTPHGCGIDYTVYLIGAEVCQRRIDAALAQLQFQSPFSVAR